MCIRDRNKTDTVEIAYNEFLGTKENIRYNRLLVLSDISNIPIIGKFRYNRILRNVRFRAYCRKFE